MTPPREIERDWYCHFLQAWRPLRAGTGFAGCVAGRRGRLWKQAGRYFCAWEGAGASLPPADGDSDVAKRVPPQTRLDDVV